MKTLLYATLASLLSSTLSFGQIAISGVAIDSVTGKPLPNAEVTLRGMMGIKPKVYTATSSATGRFVISPVEANPYSISVKLPGFVFLSAAGCTDSLCEVKASASIQIRLVPEGGVAGRVVDAAGKPVSQATVSVSSAGLFAGAQPTNEQGEFHIKGLAPGQYRIRATPFTDYKAPPAANGETHLVAGGPPNTIEVRAGAETSDLTIALKQHPVVRLAGVVAGSRDALIKVTQGTQEIATGARAQDGKFEIWRLSPGSYVISALGMASSGPVPVTIAESNVEGVELLITPSQLMKGKVVWDNPPEGVPGKPLTLGIADTMSFPSFNTRVHVEADGSFQTMMAPERHWIHLEPYVGIPRSAYVKAIRVGNGKDLAGPVFDTVHPVKGDLTVVLSAKGAEISGVVRDAKGVAAANATVVLEGPPREGSQRFHQTITDATGHFLYEGVAPGSYKLAAVDSRDYWEFVDAGSLASYEQTADKIEVREGDKISRNLKRR